MIELWYDISRSFPNQRRKDGKSICPEKFACLYLAVALLVSSIWVASADERDTVQQEVQYSAAVEALDAAGLTSRSSNVLPSGEGLALALELGLPEEETISLSQLPTGPSRPVKPRRTPPAASRRTPPQPPLTPPPRRPPVRAC